MDGFEVPKIIPTPGRFEGIDNDVYHQSWQAWSCSRLKKLEVSPAHLKQELDVPSYKDTDATILGSQVHCCVLEPEAFNERYELDPESPEGGYPKGWRNTNDYRQEKADILNSGAQIITPKNLDICRRIRDRLYDEPSAARDAVSVVTATEVTYVANEPEFGLLSKCRFDAMGDGITFDLKTTRSMSEFTNQAYNLRYHFSEPWYLDIAWVVDPGKWETFFYLPVETTAPFEFQLVEIEPEAVELARRKLTKLKAIASECEKTGVWPGYPRQLQTLRLKTWAYTQEDLQQ